MFDVDLLEVHSELWISPGSLRYAGDISAGTRCGADLESGPPQIVDLVDNVVVLVSWKIWTGPSPVHTDLVRAQSSPVISGGPTSLPTSGLDPDRAILDPERSPTRDGSREPGEPAHVHRRSSHEQTATRHTHASVS